jgi:hypothetical protein
MRAVVIVLVQLVISVLLTASLMPLVLATVPAAQSSDRVGLGLMVGLLIVCFALIALLWPRRVR